MKFQRDDVGCVFLPNVPEMPIALLGMLEVGIIASPANPQNTAGFFTTPIL